MEEQARPRRLLRPRVLPHEGDERGEPQGGGVAGLHAGKEGRGEKEKDEGVILNE